MMRRWQEKTFRPCDRVCACSNCRPKPEKECPHWWNFWKSFVCLPGPPLQPEYKRSKIQPSLFVSRNARICATAGGLAGQVRWLTFSVMNRACPSGGYRVEVCHRKRAASDGEEGKDRVLGSRTSSWGK